MAWTQGADGNRIYYEHSDGEAPALLFLHGWGHNHTAWSGEREACAEAGHATLTMDLRGHGRSDAPEHRAAYAMERFADDAVAVLDAAGVDEAVFVGHSMGGMVSLSAFDHAPERVCGLVLADTIYENPLKHTAFSEHVDLTPLTRHLLDFVLDHAHLQRTHFPYIDFSSLDDHEDFFYWLKGAEETPMRSLLSCLREMLSFDEHAVLGRIDVPTLILEGEKDSKTAVSDVRAMASRIAGAELVVVAQGSHDTDIRNPVVLSEHILSFLERSF